MWLTRAGVSLVAFPQAMLIGRATFVAVSYVFLADLGHRHWKRSNVQDQRFGRPICR